MYDYVTTPIEKILQESRKLYEKFNNKIVKIALTIKIVKFTRNIVNKIVYNKIVNLTIFIVK